MSMTTKILLSSWKSAITSTSQKFIWYSITLSASVPWVQKMAIIQRVLRDYTSILRRMLTVPVTKGTTLSKWRSCYMPVHELPSSSFSVIPVTSPSFPSLVRHSSSPSSYHLAYRSSSLPSISLSSVLHSILRHGYILPLLCSKHHSSVLWLDYLTLTSLHSCG